MKKVLLSFMVVAVTFSVAVAQTMEEGQKAVYYSKFNAANNTFKQIVAKEPNNTQAIYWLGQTMIQNIAMSDGVQQAKTLYEQAATAHQNDPWLLVGLGNIDYLNGNNAAAKQKFEQAIKITNDKSKRRQKNQNLSEIYTAIGRASAQGDASHGDPAYVIPLLEKALEFDSKNSEAGIYLGQNYLKQGGENGGKAYQAYNTAITRNPGYALAPYRIGVMYQSQGNFEAMNEWYQKAIQADPSFPAPYLTYFEYFRDNDVNKAKEFLDEFVKVAEPNCETRFFQADYSYVSGKYQEAISKGQEMLNAPECRTFAGANLLLAKSYHRLGDSVKAGEALDNYFKIAQSANITANDYASAGYVATGAPGKAGDAIKYLQKAYEMDTIAFNREKYVDSIALAYDKVNKPVEKLNWLQGLFKNKQLTDKNLVALADASFKAENYQLSDSLYTILKGKYPDDQFSYYFLQQSALATDTTKEKAVPHILEYIKFLEKSNMETKNQALVYEYSLLGDYYANTKKDFKTAKTYFEKIYAIDPSNEDVKNAIQQLDRLIGRKE